MKIKRNAMISFIFVGINFRGLAENEKFVSKFSEDGFDL
jgi:hypothetical protein